MSENFGKIRYLVILSVGNEGSVSVEKMYKLI